MRITNEMIEKSLKSNATKGFAIIDDDYIIIKGNELDIEWIDKTIRLRNIGVNYCGPIDYKKYNEKIFLLEYRAKGMIMDFFDSSMFGELTSERYEALFKEYMNVLKKLAHVPLEQYLKFFADIEEMRKENLKPDVCSLSNLFYEENEGFSFIDVYPGNQKLKVSEIFWILVNGKFRCGPISILPMDYKDKYTLYITQIYEKIIIGLRKYDYPLDEIEEYLNKSVHNFTDEDCVKTEDLDSRIKFLENKSQGFIFI